MIIIILANAWADQLLKVAVLFRHGARYPLHDIFDANETRSEWGQISPAGLRQHYTLGRQLRSLYVDKFKLLPENLDEYAIQLCSTMYNRTINSLQANMFGLYPLTTGPRLLNVSQQFLQPPYQDSMNFPKATNDFALPYGYGPTSMKDGTVLFKSCSKQQQLREQNQVKYKAKIDQMTLKYSQFINRMSTVFNFKEKTLFKLEQLYDTLQADRHLGRDIIINSTDFSLLRRLHQWLQMVLQGDQLSRIQTVPFLNKLLKDFSSTTQVKYWAYSAHEETLFPQILFHNLTNFSCYQSKFQGRQVTGQCVDGPDYAASLIFQLWQGSQVNLKLRMNGEYMQICEGVTECPWQEFKRRVGQWMLPYSRCN